MARIIKRPAAHRSARVLAGVTRLTLSDADAMALREELEGETGISIGEDLRAIGDRCGALPDLDLRRADEIVGFDEHGLPN